MRITLAPQAKARQAGTARAAACALLAVLALAPVARAETAHSHSHSHAHGHAHSADEIYKGYFDDSQIAARPLSDWAGDWQSVYPLLQAGVLDPVMAQKAEKGDKTAAEYHAYYATGYKTDVEGIAVQGDQVSFRSAAGTVTGTYTTDGYEVLTYAKGNRGVRFVFRKTGGDAAAPGFIQFSDHGIAPAKAGHYHLYWGDDRAAVLAELTNWPTYYPAALSADQILHEMLAH